MMSSTTITIWAKEHQHSKRSRKENHRSREWKKKHRPITHSAHRYKNMNKRRQIHRHIIQSGYTSHSFESENLRNQQRAWEGSEWSVFDVTSILIQVDVLHITHRTHTLSISNEKVYAVDALWQSSVHWLMMLPLLLPPLRMLLR